MWLVLTALILSTTATRAISFLSTTHRDRHWLIVPSYRCPVKQYSHPVPSNCGNPAMLMSVPPLVIAFPRIQFCCWYGHLQEKMSQSLYLSNVVSFLSFVSLRIRIKSQSCCLNNIINNGNTCRAQFKYTRHTDVLYFSWNLK